EDAAAAKRAEIMAKVMAAREKQKNEEDQKAEFFGEHTGISCDGCGVSAPLVGYRYRCKSCANHDVCENCHEQWAGGKGTVSNALNQQKLSPNAADHTFKLHKDKGFKPLVKNAGVTKRNIVKVKPNDPCPCGSGKKAKKCC
ncbi:hypothetical protein M885DRAFT_418997, partial [Pelagophyceae sp. CCMP2097]